MINLNLLSTFYHVAKLGSFVQAAEKLNVSRAIVTRHIQELEAIHETRLIHRTTRSLSLTDEGQHVYQQCLTIMETIENIEHYLGESQESVSGVIRLKIPPVLDTHALYDVLDEYSKAYPSVQLNIELDDTLGKIADEEFDLALHIGKIRNCSYICRRLASLKTFVVASPNYWEKHGRPEVPSQLSEHKCLNYSHCKTKGKWDPRCNTVYCQLRSILRLVIFKSQRFWIRSPIFVFSAGLVHLTCIPSSTITKKLLMLRNSIFYSLHCTA